jgi:hypothetical protein
MDLKVHELDFELWVDLQEAVTQGKSTPNNELQKAKPGLQYNRTRKLTLL